MTTASHTPPFSHFLAYSLLFLLFNFATLSFSFSFFLFFFSFSFYSLPNDIWHSSVTQLNSGNSCKQLGWLFFRLKLFFFWKKFEVSKFPPLFKFLLLNIWVRTDELTRAANFKSWKNSFVLFYEFCLWLLSNICCLPVSAKKKFTKTVALDCGLSQIRFFKWNLLQFSSSFLYCRKCSRTIETLSEVFLVTCFSLWRLSKMKGMKGLDDDLSFPSFRWKTSRTISPLAGQCWRRV